MRQRAEKPYLFVLLQFRSVQEDVSYRVEPIQYHTCILAQLVDPSVNPSGGPGFKRNVLLFLLLDGKCGLPHPAPLQGAVVSPPRSYSTFLALGPPFFFAGASVVHGVRQPRQHTLEWFSHLNLGSGWLQI